jgi:YaaC-like Protein
MPAPELRIGNRTAYFRKAITAPDFTSERVLARDSFQFVELWLNRKCREALPYWKQARTYYAAAMALPPQSSPLTSYYCFLNAAKTLLITKKMKFSGRHGVKGGFDPTSRRALRNESIKIKGGGVLPELIHYLNEPEVEQTHSLIDVLSNLPFIHRAFRFTFRSHPELFIPVRNLIYRKHPANHQIWLSANVDGRFADRRNLRTLPNEFEIDEGYGDVRVIRARRRVRWFDRNDSAPKKRAALERLKSYHKANRLHLVYICAAPDLWYLKRKVAGATRINRYNLTLIMAAMHRLSELSRYDPAGLADYFSGRESWLLTEFIELAPAQFIDEIVCEITSEEFGLPMIRPRAT